MKIDLHIHTRIGSDGAYTVEQVFAEAGKRNIDFMSITDHDSVSAQQKAILLAAESGIRYITGVELNVTFPHPSNPDKSVSLDFLGYNYDINNPALIYKLEILKGYRDNRAHQILENLNVEFEKENIQKLTEADLDKIQESVDGTFGRPHIANYLVDKRVVSNRQEAFDKYLVKCDVPKYPLSLADASELIRRAGGVLVIAHANDPNGTSLVSISKSLEEQMAVIENHMLEYIDGIECWHTRHDEKTVAGFVKFAGEHNLLVTGGSDCHQKPVIMGTMDIPDYVAAQFKETAS